MSLFLNLPNLFWEIKNQVLKNTEFPASGLKLLQYNLNIVEHFFLNLYIIKTDFVSFSLRFLMWLLSTFFFLEFESINLFFFIFSIYFY